MCCHNFLHKLNPKLPYLAISALSPSAENLRLAYPSPVPSPTSPLTNPHSGSATSSTTTSSASASASSSSQAPQSGNVLLFSTRSLSVSNVIRAHESSSPLSLSIQLDASSSRRLRKRPPFGYTAFRGSERLYHFQSVQKEVRIWPMNFNLAVNKDRRRRLVVPVRVLVQVEWSARIGGWGDATVRWGL